MSACLGATSYDACPCYRHTGTGVRQLRIKIEPDIGTEIVADAELPYPFVRGCMISI